MADVGIQLLHKLPLLTRWQGLGSLQQFSLQKAGWIPNLRIGEAGEMQTRRFDEREKTLEVVTGFLRVQVHVREIRVRCAVHGPAFPVMTGKAVALRQGLEQLPPQMQALRACAGIQKT